MLVTWVVTHTWGAFSLALAPRNSQPAVQHMTNSCDSAVHWRGWAATRLYPSINIQRLSHSTDAAVRIPHCLISLARWQEPELKQPEHLGFVLFFNDMLAIVRAVADLPVPHE